MTYCHIVHQPGCSNVVVIDGKYGGPQRRVFQGSREQCAGYAVALRDAGIEVRAAVICPPGDCLKLQWAEREPPITWGRDCREWAA